MPKDKEWKNPLSVLLASGNTGSGYQLFPLHPENFEEDGDKNHEPEVVTRDSIFNESGESTSHFCKITLTGAFLMLKTSLLK